MQNAPAFRLQSTKTERQVRVCEFLNRTLFLHLPAELAQRLNMPEAFAGDGAEVLAPGAHSRFGSGKNSQFKPER